MDKQTNDTSRSMRDTGIVETRREAKSDFQITDKAILGGYYNLARLNFYKTMMTILARLGLDVKKIGEDSLPKYLTIFKNKMLGIQDNLSDQKWADSLGINNEMMLTFQQLLFRHFPLLEPIMAVEASYKINSLNGGSSNKSVAHDVMRGVKLEDCLDVILHLYRTLNQLRDYYTHYNPYNSVENQKEQYRLQRLVVTWLEKVRDASRRIDKQRNNLTAREMEFLTGVDRMMSKDKVDEFGNIVRDRRGRARTVYVEYPDYYFRIGTERYLVDAKGEIIENEMPHKALSDFGVVFFCILFLEKSQARLLQDELELYENGPYDGQHPEDQAKNDILREMWGIYRIMVPRGKRLDPMNDATALAMDMLNELRKCPMELYEVLSRDAQRFFEDEINHPNENTPEVFKRLRSSDRFPHLALRFIDLNKCFDDIRFQVQLGKFRYRFYDKTTIDQDQVVRGLQKEINGYGRLQDVERLRREKYESMLQQTEQVETGEEDITISNLVPDTASSEPYLTDRTASYNIHNNRIGLYWDKMSEKGLLDGDEKYYLPELVVDDEGKAPVEMPAPKAALSVRDLPALVFYIYLRQKNEKLLSPERIIRDKHDALSRFFGDVAKGDLTPVDGTDALETVLKQQRYSLSLREIPAKLSNYLSGNMEDEDDETCADRFGSYALRMLGKRHKQVTARLDRLERAREMIGTKENRFGKKSYVGVSHRQMAEQIAQSIIEWQPSVDNGRNKLTGKNYQKLIAALAVYVDEVPLDDIKHMFQRAHLLDGPTSHPFLKQVLETRPVNIEVLYDHYFMAEKKRLEESLSIDKNRPGEEYQLNDDVDLSKFPFLHHQRARFVKRDAATYRHLAERYLQVDGRSTTIMLPDGLFTPYILKALKDKRDNKELQACLNDNDLNNNAAYLMSAYLEHVLKDSSQPFYYSDKGSDRFARRYDLFTILQNKKDKKNNELMPCPLSPMEINYRFVARAADNTRKQIEVDIENHLERIKRDAENRIFRHHLRGFWAEKVRKDCREECDKLQKRLSHKINDVKKNERAIRRYKTQDLALFLMAKHILGETLMQQNDNSEDRFLLKNVCAPGFLSQTVTAQFPLKVKVDKKQTVDFVVIQENMSIKNYGLFYLLFNDERIDTLLAKLKEQPVIRFNALRTELANYDHNRSNIFRNMQQLEQKAFDENHEALTDTNHPEFFYREESKNKITIKERRNNFKHLMELLMNADPDRLDDEVIKWLTSVRNAFSHNNFNMDMQEIDKTLPTIIDQIMKRVEESRSKIIQ